MLTLLLVVVVALSAALLVACRMLCAARDERDGYRGRLREELANKIAANYENTRLRRQIAALRDGGSVT